MLEKLGSMLPLAGAHQGRSARTCALKCGSACFHPVPNTSSSEYIGDIVEGALSRRSVLKGMGAAVVVAGVPGLVRPAPAQAATRAARSGGSSGTGLQFTPIPPTDRTYDNVVVPDGYDWSVLARWGDPVVTGAPEWDYTNQTAQAQAQQFGYNCDYVGFVPTRHGGASAQSSQGLLVVNHEYTEGDRMFPAYDFGAPTAEQVGIELAAHGMSVLEVTRGVGGAMRMVAGSAKNRRITATTPIELTGPARGHRLLQTGDDPAGTTVLGTLNNCAGGNTPWGTVLSAEENFNQYFANAAAVSDPQLKAAHARYGMPTGATERKWERFHDRFDMATEPNEPFRFGWIVEIDPSDPDFVPRKRTALGRFKHEAATIALARDGHVVAYMGDDERFDYVYKFVSSNKYREGDKAHNLTLLDEGDLYVARFRGDSPGRDLERYNDQDTLGELPRDGEFDGTGRWIPLIKNGKSKVDGFTVAEVLILTRLAADTVGATKMDRPEDVERNPVNGRVYLALTNNTDRGKSGKPGVDEANPRRVNEIGALTGNKYGHVIELAETHNDPGADTFKWGIFLVAGNPNDPTTYFAGFPKDKVSPISCPDNVAFDANGNLWIGTDGAPGTIGRADAFHAVPVSGPERGRARQFLSVPAGAEACGPEFTPDQRTLFCAVQHPGERYPSRWPDFEDGIPPRPSVISVFGANGDKRIGG